MTLMSSTVSLVLLVVTFLAVVDSFRVAGCGKRSCDHTHHHPLTFGSIGFTRTSTIMQGSADESALVISCVNDLGPEEDKNKVRLILASQSPRRREILDMMGLRGKFDAQPSPLDESALQVALRSETATPLDPVAYTQRLAEEKARALADTLTDTSDRPTLVLGSDTIVDLEGVILEKPVDEADAKATIARLSGRQHCVHTGVALYVVNNGESSKVVSFVDTAVVTFAKLLSADIDAYVATGEPMDKAGSYGIQGIGGQMVRRVEGDFFTVMGLPMHRVSRELCRAIQSLTDDQS